MRGLWFLIEDKTGEKATKPNGKTAFTEDQALKFLKAQVDRT